MAAFVLVTTILLMVGDEGLALHGQGEDRTGKMWGVVYLSFSL